LGLGNLPAFLTTSVLLVFSPLLDDGLELRAHIVDVQAFFLDERGL